MNGLARTGRAFFQLGLARTGLLKTARADPGGPCANTILNGKLKIIKKIFLFYFKAFQVINTRVYFILYSLKAVQKFTINMSLKIF
jgi:hypothetical protein